MTEERRQNDELRSLPMFFVLSIFLRFSWHSRERQFFAVRSCCFGWLQVVSSDELV